ncbi:ribosome maturation factor RimP [Denitratimonas sp. CY0512]|uniref:ribosome maturation factor RimP n=1 Tax=Denitratimonas sp. CY0512 TaxID=3131940 RepID=UPI0030963626
MSQIENQIEALLAPVVNALELELLGIEFNAGSGNAVLRLYIDVDGRAVTLEDCEAVSREVSALLDVNDPIDSHYTLEVSSPGLDRPLFKPEHFARFIGEQAKVTLEFPQDGRRRFQGRILAVADARVTLEQDGQPVELACEAIQKARLVPVFEKPAKPGRAAAAAGSNKRGA